MSPGFKGYIKNRLMEMGVIQVPKSLFRAVSNTGDIWAGESPAKRGLAEAGRELPQAVSTPVLIFTPASPCRLPKKPAKPLRMLRARRAGCLRCITERPKLPLPERVRRSYLLPPPKNPVRLQGVIPRTALTA